MVLSKYLKDNFPGGTYFSVYESGFSGFWIHEALVKEGIKSIVVNAADVPTTDKEKKNKCDAVDSRKLCKKLRNRDLVGIYVPDRAQLEDRQLVRARVKLVRDTTRCKNRIKSTLNFYGIKCPDSGVWSKRFINGLKQLRMDYESGTSALRVMIDELESIELLKRRVSRQLTMMMREEKYRQNIKLLFSIPGIGIIAAITILTELGDLRRFRRLDHLCNYIGLVPTIYSSGETEHVGSLTPRKNNYILPLLIQSAWTAAGKDPAMMQAYHQWCRRMKGQEAIIRVARKLLSRIRYVLVNRKEYQLKTVS
jgi:transposase